MEFNRRGFLIAVVGGSFITLGGDALAGAPDRYKRLIELQHALFDANEAYKAEIAGIAGPEVPSIYSLPNWQTMPTDEAKAHGVLYAAYSNRVHHAKRLLVANRTALSVQADHVLAWTMENFNGTPTAGTRQQIRDLFNGVLSIDTMSEADLRTIEDPTVNCAVARTMLSKWKLPLNTEKMESFGTFAERYKELILA